MSQLDVPVSERARELAGLDTVDYADAWAVEVSEHRPPLDWLQIAIEGRPRLFAAARVAHHGLGLKLAAAGAPRHPLGWTIITDNPSACVLAAAGMLGHARLVALTSPTRVTLATLIALNGWVGKGLWFGAGMHGHRALGPMILGSLPRLSQEREQHALTDSDRP